MRAIAAAMAGVMLTGTAPLAACGAAETAAEGSIAGAFGKRFGEPFDTRDAVTREETTDDKTLYRIEPGETPFDLSHHFVAVTPETGRIYEIWGFAYFDRGAPCQARQKEILESLAERHPDARRQRSQMALDRREHIKTASATVTVGCAVGVREATLFVQYRHRELQQLAEREREAGEKSKNGG